MSKGWVECLITAQVDGAALTNTTTRTSIIPTHAKITLPAGYFDVAGKKWKVKASGRISNVTAAPGNITFDIALGSIVIATTQAIALNATAKTNVTWELEWDLTIRAVGGTTTANAMHTAKWISESASGGVAGQALVVLIPASAPAVGAGFDSTASQLVDLFATFSTANASNSIQLHQFDILSLN